MREMKVETKDKLKKKKRNPSIMRINKFKALVRDDLEAVVIYSIILVFEEESVNPASDLEFNLHRLCCVLH